MVELCADATDERGLIATPAAMDVLAGIESGSPDLIAELERSGWLVDSAPPPDLLAVFETWAQPLATIELRMRWDGTEYRIGGVVDQYLAVLLVPVEAGSPAQRLVAIVPDALPRWIAHAVGCGLRPMPGDEDSAVPLSWEVVDRCLGRHGADELREIARAAATGRAAPEQIAAVLAPDAKRWTARLDGAGEWSGAFGAVIDVLDAEDRGLFVIAAADPGDEQAGAESGPEADGGEAGAEAIPQSSGDVWRLLASALVVPFDEDDE